MQGYFKNVENKNTYRKLQTRGKLKINPSKDVRFFFVFHTFFINQFVYQMVSTFYVFIVLGFYIGRFFKCPVFYNVWILQCSLCTDFSLYPLFAISAICNFRLIILCYGVSAHVLRWLISCGLLTTLLYFIFV